MSELKPCPFCGGEAEFHIYGRSCNVVCSRCQIGTRLEHIDEYEVAVSAWNTRATIPGEICELVGTGEGECLPPITRTCRRFWTGAEMICSECAYQLNNAAANYCHNCGAKVVE